MFKANLSDFASVSIVFILFSHFASVAKYYFINNIFLLKFIRASLFITVKNDSRFSKRNKNENSY